MSKLTAYKLVIYRDGEVVREINGYAGGEREYQDIHKQFGEILLNEAQYCTMMEAIRKAIKC